MAPRQTQAPCDTERATRRPRSAPCLAALRQRRALRRRVRQAGVQLDLVANARADGRWEVHVAGAESLALWPSVNAPTAAVALDALEAELRELLRDTGAVPDGQR